MPDIPNRSRKEFSRFDEMDDAQLREYLRLDASKPEGEASDIEELLYIMELLSTRRKERGEGRDPKKAFEEFKAYYAPRDGEDAAGDEDCETECVIELPVKKKASLSGWRRKAVIAAAVIALLVGTVATVGASRFDLWKFIAKWTKQTFYLSAENMPDDMEEEPDILSDSPYAELQGILLKNKVTDHLVPEWIPEGFEQAEFTIFELPMQTEYHVLHKNGDKELSLQIKELFSSDPLIIEQSNTANEIYCSHGIDFYILSNNGKLHANAIIGNYECFIVGDLSLAELKQMIDSIRAIN